MDVRESESDLDNSGSEESTPTQQTEHTDGDSAEEDTPISSEAYTWDDYIDEYASSSFRDDDPPTYEDIPDKHRHDDLHDDVSGALGEADNIANSLSERLDEQTLSTNSDIDEEDFFTTADGTPTVVSRYDMEKTVPPKKKGDFVELDRYWVNKPYAFVTLYRSTKENEVKYFVTEPHLNPEEERIVEFLKEKLQDSIKFSKRAKQGQRTNAERAVLIEEKTYELLNRYGLFSPEDVNKDDSDDDSDGFLNSLPFIGNGDRDVSEDDVELENVDETETEEDSNDDSRGTLDAIKSVFSRDSTERNKTIAEKLIELDEEERKKTEERRVHVYTQPDELRELDGASVRPARAVMNDPSTQLTEHQIQKILYYLKRDSISYGPIDAIKHDIGVEDISCDGYNSRVFVYHEEHEQIISNVEHGETSLDDFVVNLAQRSGKGISKRQPQVDATLPDGSRAQLTLGTEVSDHGTNYTIRQFQEIPHTPIDLINWGTFAPSQMAFLWLVIENKKSLIFAGGTASGKTTSLNAVSLFIPSNSKIVSIEDTREVELPQRNWVASVTRPSFTQDGAGDVDEFDLLEAALRQRPDYIVMGEIRGEEGRTLFQVMSTGHTTYTTFHADSVGEVIKRFTTEPINVSKTLFTALDLISIQTQTRVNGKKVRRNKILTEVNDFSAETNEINVNDVYEWIAEDDSYNRAESSQVLEDIKFDRGWQQDRLEEELEMRKTVIAYLIKKQLNTYTQVAATVQTFINEPDVILNLIADEELHDSLEDLREMESVMIDIDPDKENMVPRPGPTDKTLSWSNEVLERARSKGGVLYGRESDDDSIADVLSKISGDEEPITDDDTSEQIDNLVETAAAQDIDISDITGKDASEQETLNDIEWVDQDDVDQETEAETVEETEESEEEEAADEDSEDDESDDGTEDFSGFVIEGSGEPEMGDDQ